MRIADLLLEDRVDWLRNRYLPLIRSRIKSFRIPGNIASAIKRSPGATPEQQIFNWLVSRDPTPNRQYLGWILACAIDRGVPFEDIEYLPETLARYHERKRTNKLPAEARDINRIKTPSQLDVLLRDASNTEIAADEAETKKARQESQVLLDDDAWLAVIPRTEFAAQFWGRGTQWCTAWGDPRGLHPTRSCQFDEYNGEGPMVILINKTDPSERYQFHQEAGQYMDRDDNGIGIDGLLGLAKRHPAFIPVLLPYLPVVGVLGDESQQLAAVRRTDNAIVHIKNPSEALKLAAVQRHGWEIQNIEDPSEALKLAAVRRNGNAIQHIENPSEALQIAAVRQDGYAIVHIKNPSEAVKMAAVRRHGWAIQFIKNPSEAVQMAAVRRNGNAIQFIENPSEALQIAAVQQDGYAIVHIKNPSEAVIEIARKQGWDRHGNSI